MKCIVIPACSRTRQRPVQLMQLPEGASEARLFNRQEWIAVDFLGVNHNNLYLIYTTSRRWTYRYRVSLQRKVLSDHLITVVRRTSPRTDSIVAGGGTQIEVLYGRPVT